MLRGSVFKKTLWALAPALAAFLVFLPALRFAFVNYDDPVYVYENPGLGPLGIKTFKWAWTAIVSSNWHPLTLLSLSFDYSFWGLDPTGYHLGNIVLHSINAALVFFVSSTVFKRAGWAEKDSILPSLIAAFIFGLHPLRVESVVWVSERKDVLCAFFFLLSVLAYFSYAGKAKGWLKYYFLSVVFFALALLSKTMAVSLPIVLLILDFYPLERLRDKKVIYEKAPFIALSAVFAGIAVWAQKNAIAPQDALPFDARFLTAAKAYFFYIYKMLCPLQLAPLYPHPVDISLASAGYIGAVVLFILVTTACVIAALKNKLFLAVWACYVVTLLPVIGIVQIGIQAAADRYTYLPGIAPAILAGAAAGYLAKRKRHMRFPVITAALAMAVIFGGLTLKQERVWKDSISLWTHELSYLDRHPDTQQTGRLIPVKVIPLYNRGLAFMSAGDLPAALADFTSIIGLDPQYVNAYVNRGVVFAMTGKYDHAIDDLNRAIVLAPADPDAYSNLSKVYSAMGDEGKAAYFSGMASKARQGASAPPTF